MKKLSVNSPEYRDLVGKLLGKEVKFDNLPSIPTSPSRHSLMPILPQPNISSPSVKTPSPELHKMIGITGNKETDFIVLSNLNDDDLARLCSVNKYTRDLCRDENFWMNRTIKRFNRFSTNINSDRNKLGMTWKGFYFYLISALEHIYHSIYGIEQFRWKGQKAYSEILKNINKLVEVQTLELDNAILNKNFIRAKEILKRDFVNPNALHQDLRMNNKVKYDLKYITKNLEILLNDSRFDPANYLAVNFVTHGLQDKIIEMMKNGSSWEEVKSFAFKTAKRKGRYGIKTVMPGNYEIFAGSQQLDEDTKLKYYEAVLQTLFQHFRK